MKKLIALSIIIAALFGCSKDDDDTPAAVTAAFSFAPTEVTAGEVRFTNLSVNAKSYRWDFGDGQTSTVKNPLHVFSGQFPFTVSLIAANGNQSDTVTHLVYDEIMVYKPNIYIHPQAETNLCLSVSFPMGGKIVQSIPQYNNGWCVNVKPSGLIDNTYQYLFYESKQPDIFQYTQGWCIAKADLKSFFETNMAAYNFSASEIKDFTDYWIPLLADSPYYAIYPQTNPTINRIIQLNFSAAPHNTGRLFYGVVASDQPLQLNAPVVEPFARSGFYVMEWGVFLK